jgi:DNA-binding NtrC family response regulator
MAKGATTTVLVVDDEPTVLSMLERYLRSKGCLVKTAEDAAGAHQLLDRQCFDVAIIDYGLPDGVGAEIARTGLMANRIRCAYCITGNATCTSVVEAMRAGFLDVLEKPFDVAKIDDIIGQLRPAAADLADWRALHAPNLIGDHPAFCEALQIARDVADTECTVLITGESGTGKELLARALHLGASRRTGPFIAVNSAAIPESLVEAELFGHTRGAFTGAVNAREGRLVAALGGTLFLDEIGDMPGAAQAKMLRVLQEGEVTPLGADHPTPVDVRVIAATNRDPEAMIEAGSFRADLFFRLSVIRIHLPPLRERQSDILPLANHYLALSKRRLSHNIIGLDPAAQSALENHAWPGNVRELANAIERAVIMRREGMITARDLRLGGNHGLAAGTGNLPVAPSPASASLNLRAALDNVERDLILQALERTGGNRTEAAALLGLNRTTLVEKLRKLSS